MLIISSTVKEKPPVPGVFFIKAKDKILGKGYELSLVFVGRQKMRYLNVSHRNIDAPTDILSFPLDKTVGEIFIYLEKARQRSSLFDRSYANYLKFLFIHGLCHLKGMDHGSRMEAYERKFRKVLKV